MTVQYLLDWTLFETFRKRYVKFLNITTEDRYSDYYIAVLNAFYTEPGDNTGGTKTIITKLLKPIWHRLAHTFRYEILPPYKIIFVVVENDVHNLSALTEKWGPIRSLIRVIPPHVEKITANVPNLELHITPTQLASYNNEKRTETVLFNYIQSYVANYEVEAITIREKDELDSI